MADLFRLRYEGEGIKKVPGVGEFKTGTEMDVSEQVAANFSHPDDRSAGWLVISPKPQKTTKPFTGSQSKPAGRK